MHVFSGSDRAASARGTHAAARSRLFRAACQAQGVSSARRRFGQSSTSLVSTSASQASGFTPCSLQVSISEASTAQFSAPRSWPANSAFLRLSAIGRIERSTVLESISMRPSSRKRIEPVPLVQGVADRLGERRFPRQFGRALLEPELQSPRAAASCAAAGRPGARRRSCRGSPLRCRRVSRSAAAPRGRSAPAPPWRCRRTVSGSGPSSAPG